MAFFDPTQEALTKLSQPWIASYSGGKDSTSLVTWVEWLRRTGWLSVDRPRLVMSDTGVEYPKLVALSHRMMGLLRGCGWECTVVMPALHQRLYNRILGIGNTPIHPGVRRLRWCTQSTKIDPMAAWKGRSGGGLNLTGVRLGESAMRDGKLKKAMGCAAGGECGLPAPGGDNYAPILNWKTCNVVDWLMGCYWDAGAMDDVLSLTRQLMEVYEVQIDRNVFDGFEPDITVARFGCIGCPAIAADSKPPASVLRRHGPDSPLNELYDVWFQARRRVNRCYRPGKPEGGCSKLGGYGPIRLHVRKYLFDRVMGIQWRAGVVLVTPEDEAFIRDCWARKVYPRGWSEADEDTVPPSAAELY